MYERHNDVSRRPRPSGQILGLGLGHISDAKIHLIPPLSEYEGRLINKTQNSVILLVFQILKIKNIHFVRNLILSSSCEFYDDDFTVTLFINIKYGDVATDILPLRRQVLCKVNSSRLL